MKIANTKLKKTLIIVISSIIIIIMVVIILISPITKYLIEKYDVKYTGRQIKMSWIYVNPFTGYIYINNLKIYESDSLPALAESDSVFFSAKGLSVNFAMRKMLSKTFEITKLTLEQPRGIITQNKNDFNFNDLIKKFTPEKPAATPSKIHFNILNVKINDGEFYYREKLIPINYFIKNVNFESKGKRWDADTIPAKFSFLSGIGSGDMKGDFTINLKSMDYRLAVIVHKFDLNIIGQYLKDLTNYGSFSANLDADFKSTGNLIDRENVTNSGLLAINDFHFGITPKDDYASFDKLVLAIREMSPKKHIYFYDSVSLSRPYFKYELYDSLDNIQNMFGEKGANIVAAKADPARFNLVIEIANYIKLVAKNFFISNYRVNRLVVYKGNLKFNDFSTSEKFSIELNPLNIIADSIDKARKWVDVSVKSGIEPYGNISMDIRVSPKDSGDFDLQYNFLKLPVSMFNPYIRSYTSFALDRGTIEFRGNWNVRNGIIKSVNHLVLIDPRVTKRLRNKDLKWIPVPLIMSFIRERGNFIDYEIPITGNLKDPKFHLQDVFLDLLGNIFVKPPTTPYRMMVKSIETEIEKSLTLMWNMRQTSFLPIQEKFVNKMAEFLEDNSDASISVYPMLYTEKEKEYIRFFEAKKKYFLLSKDKNAPVFNKDDSLQVDKLSVKDSLFVKYLNKQVRDTMLFTIQEKCNKYIGSANIEAKFQKLNKEREDVFMLHFSKKGVGNRVKMFSAETTIPYNGFSFYKIVYKGELPKSLIKAYQQMNELNKEDPRKSMAKERKRIKNVH